MKELIESKKTSKEIVSELTEGKLSPEELEKAKKAHSVIQTQKAGPEYKQAVKTIWDIADKYSDRPIRTTQQALKVLDFIEPSLP